MLAGEVAGAIDVDIAIIEGMISRVRHCFTVMLWVIT